MSREQILIDVKTLRQALAQENWVVADCRHDLTDPAAGRRSYGQGHLPGAIFLDMDRDLAGPIRPYTGRHPLPEVGHITATLGERGIGNTDTVVVYDGGNGGLAARAWWILRWLGHEAVYLLDGGFSQWMAAGFPIELGEARRGPQSFHGDANNTIVLTTEELVSDLSLIPDRKLLDARDRPRFRGEVEPIDAVAGHIPGSVNVPFTDFVTKEGRWRSLAERTAMMEAALGDDREVSWSVMCGSGVTACHLAISGLEAGFSAPRLYVGSWSEWIRDPDRPVGSGEG
jgi:thiosulfate/3-mercaptopyruvate sulfurtransferase